MKNGDLFEINPPGQSGVHNYSPLENFIAIPVLNLPTSEAQTAPSSSNSKNRRVASIAEVTDKLRPRKSSAQNPQPVKPAVKSMPGVKPRATRATPHLLLAAIGVLACGVVVLSSMLIARLHQGAPPVEEQAALTPLREPGFKANGDLKQKLP